MSSPIISVKGIGKQYKLGLTHGGRNYKTLRDTIAYKSKNLLQIPRNLRSKSDGNNCQGHKYQMSKTIHPRKFWALRNISFEVQQGEVLGIIGKNGAGKTTLLKVLSQITEPTEGEIRIRGRVASLLEVGTGFHPELTGRENIFMNGAILGMSRYEIKKKFDEIVAFAEVEKFIDTPVKRYSSGMYVRLAFAVAAHLEPEILLVDEVLAVGDVSFQKKSAKKMKEVSGEGRTVLFVSHNLFLVRTMCSRCLLLDKGELIANGNPNSVIGMYLTKDRSKRLYRKFKKSDHVYGVSKVRVEDIAIVDDLGNILKEVLYHQPIRVRVNLNVLSYVQAAKFSLGVVTADNVNVLMTHSFDNDDDYHELYQGKYEANIGLENILKPGEYKIEFGGHHLPSTVSLCHIPDALYFHISDRPFIENEAPAFCNRNSLVDANSNWKIELFS